MLPVFGTLTLRENDVAKRTDESDVDK